jgi:ABC-type dipeptide/oligopeptide/nickel transport system permease subunit
MQHLGDAWWLSAFPGMALALAVIGFNLLGDGLRDLLEPRLALTAPGRMAPAAPLSTSAES